MTNIQIALLGICLFASPALMFAAWVFVACRYLEHVESLLKNSKIIVGNRDNLSRAGLLGKVLRVGGISAMLSVSQFCVRKGLVDAGDLQAVPDRIKRLLIVLWLLHLSLFASLASFCIWVGVLRG
ncbi:hypothetical protein KMS_R01410 [Pseudomonas sp. LRP2-20]|uniref:hypothetical protein n=1 Tax=Pseudomonas sp. LRP2-20 TaxID=2944234 RepID=UPI00218BC0CF|nr:hypothetical protein [Pseudomonas sp. LRP2-20]BDM20382.1 hypothetical protein KMS_R01410 [Pseudomonas sp. LRP2-20]